MREKERDVHWVHNSISYVYFINMILKRFYYFRNFPSKMYDRAHKKVKWDSVMHAIYVDRLHLSSFLHILLFCIVTSVLLIRVCCWCWKWSKCRCKLWVYVFHITISNEKKKHHQNRRWQIVIWRKTSNFSQITFKRLEISCNLNYSHLKWTRMLHGFGSEFKY